MKIWEFVQLRAFVSKLILSMYFQLVKRLKVKGEKWGLHEALIVVKADGLIRFDVDEENFHKSHVTSS
jgi:hypothetical protein